MNVTVGNTLKIENPTDEIKIWCKKNLVIANPDYAKKARMHLWLGNTSPTLSLYERRGDMFILPFGTLRQLNSMQVKFKSEFETPVSVDYGQDIPLYDYQTEAVNAVLIKHYGILQAPAGSGKTQMGIALVKKFGKRALWLTHTLDLLRQSKSRAEQYMPSELIGTITEGKVDIGKGITFATVQTMCKLELSKYKHYFDVIIVDECHRCSGTPTALSQFYKVVNSLSARHKIGLSATVHRSDGLIQATHALLGEVVHTVSEDAVGDRIMKVGIQVVATGVEMTRECMNTDGTLNYTSLITYLCNNHKRNELIIKHLLDNSDNSCLILSDRLAHLEALIGSLPSQLQDKAVMISGKMTTKKGKAQRNQAIDDMRTGRKKMLFATYNLCKEGLDIPCLERLFLTTIIKDYAACVQSVGRIARAYEGKADPLAYDFIDNFGYAVRAYKQRCRHYRKIGCYFVCEGRSKNADFF